MNEERKETELFDNYAEIVVEKSAAYADSSGTHLKANATDARRSSDQIVNRVVNDMLQESGEHYALYAQYMDNPDFKARLDDYVFAKVIVEPINSFGVYETNDGNLNLFVQNQADDSINFARDYKDSPTDIVPAIKAVQGGDDAKTWVGNDAALAELSISKLGRLVAHNDGINPAAMRETAREAFSLTLEDFVAFEKYTNKSHK